MGIRTALRLRQTVEDVTASLASGVIDPSTYPIASPFSSTDLNRIVFSDVFGDVAPLNTRGAAMRIPAVARARNLLVSTICRFPLRAYRAELELPPADQPTWLHATNQAQSPQLRLAWTVDDLLFYGWSLWARTNRGDGFPQTMTRVNREDWSLTDDLRVEINGVVQRDQDVTLIPGLHEGILSYGADALTDARDLYAIVRQRILNPIPQIELHQVAGDPLTTTEIDALIDRWAAARAGRNGGVGYTNQSIELKEHGGSGENLLIEARNAASLDLARVVGVSASQIDATAPKASLNYETTTGRNLEFVDFDLALYMTPITARLSLDDVLPRGQRVAFDVADFTTQAPSVSGPRLED